MKSVLLFLGLAVFGLPSVVLAVQPDPKLTPGSVCTPDNPDFVGYRYPAHVAYCRRDVSDQEKMQVAQEYGGIPRAEWGNYEFDHLIPLNAGGDSEISNLWPEPIAEAHEKDQVEDEVYKGLKSGQLTQEQAVQMIMDWVRQ